MSTHTSCCKTESSISPPSSPCSSHSSLSLGPLTSSPSSSSCLHAETFCCVNNPLSSSYTHSLLDTPSSATSSLGGSHSQHSLKKRLALCQLDDVAPPKRLCDMDVYQNATTSSDSASSFLNVSDQFASLSHRNELVLGGGAGYAGLATTGDLDDFLDLLLQGADAMPAPLAAMELADVREGGASLMMNTELGAEPARTRCPVFSFEFEHCKEEGNELIDSKPYPKFTPIGSSAQPQCASDVDEKELSMGTVGVRGDNVKWSLHMKGAQELGDSDVGSFCQDRWRERAASYIADTELSSRAAQHNQQKESNGMSCTDAISSSMKCSGSRWAGPTLMEIESALALTSSPAISYPPLVSSPFAKAPYLGSSSYLCSLKDILNQETSSFFTTSSSLCKEEPTTLEEEDGIATWRKLQKRSQMEPRYTVKIRSEEDAVSDGYRWRKYGQKSIKNSPHPRSYYRCSSGKCGVKKQVERSSEDAGVLVVSYEGIHLHHRPTSLPTPSLHTCASAPRTREGAPPSSSPNTNDNNTSTTRLSQLLLSSPRSHTSSNSS